MALAPLATTADLSARNITIGGTLEAAMLAAASAHIRAAAASPVSQTTSTVELTGWADDAWLRLPGLPVTAVASVEVDGATVTDYRLTGGALWRRAGWGVDEGPAAVTVTLTHGLPVVPADIVDLACSLAAAGAAAATEGGYGSDGRVVAERIDDYSVTFAEGAEAVAAVMELPRGTRRRLRSRFGGGAGSVTYR